MTLPTLAEAEARLESALEMARVIAVAVAEVQRAYRAGATRQEIEVALHALGDRFVQRAQQRETMP